MKSAPTNIYLIEAEMGFVKIGRADDPDARLAAIAASVFCPVRLVARWPGIRSDEQDLHRRFREFHHHREWFALRGEFAEFVNEKRGLGLPGIPSWQEITDRRAAGRRSQGLKIKALWADPEYRRRIAAWRADLKAKKLAAQPERAA